MTMNLIPATRYPLPATRYPLPATRYRGSHSPLAYQDFGYFGDRVRAFSGLVAERLQAVTTERDGGVVPLQAASGSSG